MINITNIERFATHDGPGIRTVVFFKGCPLFCPWCANPETQSLKPVLLYTKSRCIGCHTCAENCPVKAITYEKQSGFYHNSKICIDCRICEKNCLTDAIEFQGKELELEMIMAEVMKDKDYYDNSNGGGITISGGEPFVQIDGLVAILKASHAIGLNTAIETTGSYALKQLQLAEPYINHFLFDFKHLDDTVLSRVTGGNGTFIKTNLNYLINRDASKVNVRMPIIPEFNNEPKLIRETLRYLKKIGVKKVDLLPYHTLGKLKYEKMGIDYQMNQRMMLEKELEEFRQYALNLGMESEIGA